MQKKSKCKILNMVMVALVVVIAACGVVTAGYLKGWFTDSSDVRAGEVTGIVNVERSGVAYTLDEDTSLKSGDIIETKSGSSVIILKGHDSYALSENSEMGYSQSDDGKLSVTLSEGESFIALKNSSGFTSLEGGGCIVETDGSVFAADVRKGSVSVRVFSGEVKLTNGKKSSTAGAGRELTVTGGKISSNRLEASSLNDFNIKQAKAAGKDFDLCFSSKDLDKVVADREKEIKTAEKERKIHEEKVIAAGESSSEGSSSSSASSGSSGKSGDSGSSSSGGSSVKTCTISIKCGTILKNKKDLTKGKERYVPDNGVILAASTVEFKDGESVFDVLKRACDATGIQLEYAYSPGYGTNYIEGINNLYEFDCGSQSGWIYKVNGWAPNYGCSSYKLKGGESIVWEYTCKGYGSDT